MRLELTPIDSMSLPLQVVYDPFEQQNPYTLLLAAKSGGHAISTPAQLAEVLRNVGPRSADPQDAGLEQLVALAGLLGVLTIEWCWRRRIGLA